MYFAPLYVLAFVALCYWLGQMNKKRIKRCLHRDVTHYIIGKEQHNTTITIPINSGILLSLDDNPSTGYMWEFQKDGSDLLMKMREPEHKPLETHTSHGDMLVGGGGHILYRFWAGQEGQTTVTLCHRQPWMPVGSCQFESEFSCTIVVTNSQVFPPVEAVHV